MEIPISDLTRNQLEEKYSKLHAAQSDAILQLNKTHAAEMANLKAKIQQFEAENSELKVELKKAKTPSVFRHKSGIVFKRNVETGGAWLPFCPLCDSPLIEVDLTHSDPRACCVDLDCSRCFTIPASVGISALVKELPE